MPSNYREGERPSWHIFNVLRGIDLFGEQVPSFNIKGENFVNTVVGGMLTGVIYLIVLAFAGLKMIQLVNKNNPVMSEVERKDHYGPLDQVFYNDIDFRMAFSVEGFRDNERKDSEEYVKWMARHWYTTDEGVET